MPVGSYALLKPKALIAVDLRQFYDFISETPVKKSGLYYDSSTQRISIPSAFANNALLRQIKVLNGIIMAFFSSVIIAGTLDIRLL